MAWHRHGRQTRAAPCPSHPQDLRTNDDMSDERTEGGAAPAPSKKKDRTGPAQFTREVRGELKRVQWPSRKEVTSYSIVVLVSVALITTYVFAIDQAFGAFVLNVFG
jgi:preprotein translocase subunit SecE